VSKGNGIPTSGVAKIGIELFVAPFGHCITFFKKYIPPGGV